VQVPEIQAVESVAEVARKYGTRESKDKREIILKDIKERPKERRLSEGRHDHRQEYK
jgi:hypothetical protein